MSTNPAQGILSSAGFKTEATPGTKIALTGVPFLDLISEECQYDPVHLRAESIIGNRQEQGDLEVVSHHDGRGVLTFRVRRSYIVELLALIFGDVLTGVYFPVLDNISDLDTFTCEVDKGGLNNIRLIGNKVNVATFSSDSNMPLMCALDFLSMSGERDVGDLAVPVYTGWMTKGMFMHGDMVIDTTDVPFLGGATPVPIRSIEFALNNNLDDSEAGFTNSTTRKIIPVGMFEVTGNMVVPYNTVTAGLIGSLVGSDKAKWGISYSDGVEIGDYQLDFDFVTKFEGDLPAIASTDNQWLTLNFHGVVDVDDIKCATAEVTILA